MGSSDYRVVLLIDRRGANVFNQDLELYKAFFKVCCYACACGRLLLKSRTTPDPDAFDRHTPTNTGGE